MIHKIRKGQVRWVKKGDVLAQNRFIDCVFGRAARTRSPVPPFEALPCPSLIFATHPITGAIHALVERAIESGDIRRDLDPLDLLRALIGVSNVASGPDWQQSVRRLVDILITGSRPIK